MRCADIMTANPLTVRATDSTAQAAEILIAHRQLSVPVVDDDGRYVGMFGAGDLASLMVPRVAIAGNLAPNLRFVGEDARVLSERFQELRHKPVQDLADKNAVVLSPDTPHMETFRMLCRNPVPLAVVDPKNGK